MSRLFAVGLISIAIVACASNVGNLQRATASTISPTPLPDSVRVTEVSRAAASVKWVATVPGGDTYDCSADDMVRRPVCAKRKKL